MAVQLDHTIIPAHDKQASAAFLADILGLTEPVPAASFMVVEVDHGLSLDFMDAGQDVRRQHYAFLVSEPEFEAIFDRIRERALPYWADPFHSRPGEIYQRGAGRGFYFEDPSGHNLEVLTRPA